MKLEVGQFVRTKDGIIGKYFGEKAYEPNKICIWTETTKEGIQITPIIDKDTIVKASYSIIDILEVGDYVNGYYVEDVLKTFVNVAVGSNYFQSPTIYEKDIKSIVTKEQFENMKYGIAKK